MLNSSEVCCFLISVCVHFGGRSKENEGEAMLNSFTAVCLGGLYSCPGTVVPRELG